MKRMSVPHDGDNSKTSPLRPQQPSQVKNGKQPSHGNSGEEDGSGLDAMSGVMQSSTSMTGTGASLENPHGTKRRRFLARQAEAHCDTPFRTTRIQNVLSEADVRTPTIGAGPGTPTKAIAHWQATLSVSPPRRRKLPTINDTSKDTRSIFHRLLDHAVLIHELAKHLSVDDLVRLYSISKDFRAHADARFTTMIMDQANVRCPGSARVFTFKCYNNLCQFDPAKRPNEVRREENRIRDVPTFRYLRFLLHREEVIDDIVALMAEEGHRMPAGTKLAMRKLWFTMDVPDNLRRIGLLHNTRFWTDKDLFLATFFMVKLDMRLTDPMDGSPEPHAYLRKLLLAQRNLTTVRDVLSRDLLTSHTELLKMFVEWKYRVAPEHRTLWVCGVPPRRIGCLSREYWNPQMKALLPIDQGIMHETLRRKLSFEDRYMDIMLWGFIDEETEEDIWPQKSVVKGHKPKPGGKARDTGSLEETDMEEATDSGGETGGDENDVVEESRPIQQDGIVGLIG